MIEARAPGKLLLTGEYAVLSGSPAVCAAVGGPALATVQDADHWALTSSAADKVLSFDLAPPRRVVWSGPASKEATDLPAAVIAECLRRWPDRLRARPRLIGVDTTAFVQTLAGKPAKLGLGSSSAAVVALAGALLAACEISLEADEFRGLCLAVHRAFQQGRGSGMDVVTAIHGGVLVATPGAGDLRPEPVPWPVGLHLVVAWTGRAASTTELIARYEAFQAREPGAFEGHRERLSSAALAAAQAWRGGDLAAVLHTLAESAEALRAIDAAGGIGIWTAEHDHLASLAAAAGGVYKTSGAGGGDLGFILTDSVGVAARFRAAVRDSGQWVLDLVPGQPGLEIAGN